jgi:hypothetical protein
MSHFDKLPEFEKEFSKLSKKYPSLAEDLKKFEKLISLKPVGFGVNFVIIHHSEKVNPVREPTRDINPRATNRQSEAFSNGVKIVKARLACKSLRNRSIRIIYAYHGDTVTFVYIELYFKGDKENEDRERIRQYIKKL